MADQAYTYDIPTDLTNGVNLVKLEDEIQASSINKGLRSIVVDGDSLIVTWKSALNTTEKTTWDGDTTAPCGGILGAHDGTPYADQDIVSLDMATIQNPDKDVQRVAVQPGRSGYYMNGRDFLLRTAKMTDAVEDLRVVPSTLKRQTWGEMSLVGVYKGDDVSGYTLCTDQTDADANAVLSVFDYAANDQEATPAPIDIDIMGGMFWVDDSLVATDRWKHQIYSIMAPDIPKAMGGQVPFFDNYMYPHKGNWTSCMNTLALPLDPSAAPAAAVVRTYLYYEAGTSFEHIMGLRMYRKVW